MLINELANDYLKGTNSYLATLLECFTLLSHWVGEEYPKNTGPKGVAFTNVGANDEESGHYTLVNSGGTKNRLHVPDVAAQTMVLNRVLPKHMQTVLYSCVLR